MNSRRLINLIPVFALTLALVNVSCSDSDSPTDTGGGGSGDNTPPEIASVTAIDERHIEVEFDEDVRKETAEHRQNYVIVEQSISPLGMAAGPDDTLSIDTAVLGTDGRTVTVTTNDNMGSVPYGVFVNGVEDVNGNRITTEISETFDGDSGPDVTDPEVVFRSPADGATGVSAGAPVVVQFSERMNRTSVEQSLTMMDPGGPISLQMDEDGDNRFVFSPTQGLTTSTTYNVELSMIAADEAGNNVAASSWSFTTTAAIDNTRPLLVSTMPTNGATNVPVGTNLTLTFSEPMNQFSEIEIFVIPEIDDGVESWTNGGSKLNFDPDGDLMANTQYTLIIPSGALTDLAGNPLDGTTELVFSTGSALLTGSVEGTVDGDPDSPGAADPEGGTVIVTNRSPGSDDNGDDGLAVRGAGVIDSDGDYDINYLPDGWYWPICIFDSNGDGRLRPEEGDAVGALGVDFSQGVGGFDSVQVVGGGTVSGADFALYDPSAISGQAIYSGVLYQQGFYQILVAALDTAGFDIGNPQPTFDSDASFPDDASYDFNELDGNLDPGTYYIGAYMEVGPNDGYTPGVDPIGWYEDGGLIPITVADGSDALNIDIIIHDPGGLANALSATTWRKSAHVPSAETEARKQLLMQVRRMLDSANR